MDNIRKVLQAALAYDRKRIKDIMAAFAHDYPEVFRRGAEELLKPPMDAEYKRKQSRLLQAIQDPQVLMDALKKLEQQTSAQEVQDLLGGT